MFQAWNTYFQVLKYLIFKKVKKFYQNTAKKIFKK